MAYVDRAKRLLLHSFSDGDPRFKTGDMVLLRREMAATGPNIDFIFWFGLYVIDPANQPRCKLRNAHGGHSENQSMTGACDSTLNEVIRLVIVA